MNEYGQPPSRPQAMNGSPEGQVPLALSAQDAPGEGRESRGTCPSGAVRAGRPRRGAGVQRAAPFGARCGGE